MDKASKKVLVIGNGGREHALGWKLKQSSHVAQIYFAAGNGGTALLGENTALDVTDHNKVIVFCKEKKIDLVVVAPDDPLSSGLVDALNQSNILAFGPTKASAEVEWSKAFAKQLMKEENIPTARFETFSDYKEARKYLDTQELPIVIKASGLALGKGVVIVQNRQDAEKVLEDIMIKKVFGAAGEKVIIEEFLQGHEVSIHAFCDGKTAVLFPVAQDHKPIFENDKGPNTGGMGTVVPVSWVTSELLEEIKVKIVEPTLAGLKKRNRVFKGCLYPGLMITKTGPKVLEFNARFGDPETQSYMRLLKTDIYDIFVSCAKGNLGAINIEWENKSACCIVLASAGYPATSQKGIPITGIDKAEQDTDIVVFHAGSKNRGNDIVTNGGRVLGVTATGETLSKALMKAYQAVDNIKFNGKQYRRDIGKRRVLR